MSDGQEPKTRRTLERLAAAQELASIGSWTLELPDGGLEWSRQMYCILGLDPDKDTPSIAAYQGIIHPDDVDRIRRLNEESMRKGEPAEATHRIIRPDGEERVVHAVSTVVEEDGRPATLHGILQDITDQKATHEQEAKRFQALLDAAPDAIVITDRDGAITYTNRQVRELFGYEPEELLGQKVEILVPHCFQGRHPEHRAGFHEHPKTRPMGAGLDLAAVHKDGHELPVEISLAPLEVAEGRLVMAAIRNITDRKQVERTERLAFEQELKIQQLEDANAFRVNLLNTVAHELNTPLTPLTLQLHILANAREDLPEPHRHAVDILGRNVRRLSLLVSDILDMSRLQNDRLELRMEPTTAADLVDETIETFSEAAREGKVTLEGDTEKGLAFVGDGARITQVLYNLVGNALKFTTAGGSVHVCARSDGDTVAFEVQDDGMGITGDEAKALFRPFSQVHEGQTQKGTGLGLFISQGIMEQHGGSLTMSSKGRNKGSTFTARLPKEGIAS